MTTNTLVNDKVASFLEMSSYNGGSLDFLLGQLWVLMDLPVDFFVRFKIWAIKVEDSLRIHCVSKAEYTVT